MSTGLALAAVSLAPVRLARASGADRVLAFHHLHTGETLALSYRRGDDYLPESLKRIDHCLRDHVNGAVYRTDRELLDYLYDVRAALDTDAPFEVVCGYRSPGTNAAAAQHSKEVDPKSLHMIGRAVDVRLPGRRLADLRQAALKLHRGGVGLYTRDNFVHLDTGDVRSW